MARSAPAIGKVVLFNKETGERIERWSIDAREILATGEWTTSSPDSPETSEVAQGDQNGSPEDGDLPEGYKIVQLGSWHKLFDAEDNQVGASQRSREEALALLPATLRPGGTAPATSAEHSPGVPLKVGEAGEARPIQLP